MTRVAIVSLLGHFQLHVNDIHDSKVTYVVLKTEQETKLYTQISTHLLDLYILGTPLILLTVTGRVTSLNGCSKTAAITIFS